MDILPSKLLLADDDADDCMFFKEAVEELGLPATVTTVNDGEQLMHLLSTKPDFLPDVLFLDLNMPRKSGFECLTEIKNNEKLKAFPVIIYSTSFDQEVANLLYEKGAHYYIRKPGDFSKLKKVIHDVLTKTAKKNPVRPSRDKFLVEV